MAKNAKKATTKKTTKVAAGGPFVVAALICEKVLVEKDEVSTVTRIVDRVTLPAKPPSSKTKEEPDVGYSELMLFLSIKSGDATGKHTFAIDLITPSNRRRKGDVIPITLLGGGHGVNIRGNLPIAPHEPGLHWYEVLIDGKALTRTPLEIQHENPKTERAPVSDSDSPQRS